MRLWPAIAMAVALIPRPTFAQTNCLDPVELVRMDAEWEQALLNRDGRWLETHLAGDFIWVHNHASAVDTKTALLEQVIAPQSDSQQTRSRVQSDVEARVLASTGVVTGFTVVDRGPSPIRFNFMRTYALQDGRCLLLGNHTMVVPSVGQIPGGDS
jgi:hypothetical protein